MLLVYFYKTSSGSEIVREWLRTLDPLDRKAIGEDLQTVQLGWDIGLVKEPLVKSLGEGILEVRSRLPSKRTARIFFCVYQQKIVLLHGFIKKTQKLPKRELELAKKRKKTLR